MMGWRIVLKKKEIIAQHRNIINAKLAMDKRHKENIMIAGVFLNTSFYHCYHSFGTVIIIIITILFFTDRGGCLLLHFLDSFKIMTMIIHTDIEKVTSILPIIIHLSFSSSSLAPFQTTTDY